MYKIITWDRSKRQQKIIAVTLISICKKIINEKEWFRFDLEMGDFSLKLITLVRNTPITIKSYKLVNKHIK